MKVMCDEEEEPKTNETDIELKTSIETADVSKNEIDDEPSFDESDLPGINSNPEVINERIDEPVDNTEIEEVELGIDVSEMEGSGEETTENAMETTEEPVDNTEIE